MYLNSFLLALAAFIWGSGFVATKWTLIDYGPFWSNSLRMIFASIIILPVLFVRIKNFKDPKLFKKPFIISIFLFIGMQTQTIGLNYTTVAKSGFITALYAVFTPLLLIIFQRVRYQKTFWPLLGISLFGTALLCDMQFEHFNIGDAWTLACALGFAIHIILVGQISSDYDPVILNGLQCVYNALLAVPCALYFEGIPSIEPLLQFDQLLVPSTILGFIILGLFSSNIAFTIQCYAQKSIPPQIVSVIFLLESVFAAYLGYLFFDEKLTISALIGCLFVMTAVGLMPVFGKEIKGEK